jgi:hypothetical protein
MLDASVVQSTRIHAGASHSRGGAAAAVPTAAGGGRLWAPGSALGVCFVRLWRAASAMARAPGDEPAELWQMRHPRRARASLRSSP